MPWQELALKIRHELCERGIDPHSAYCEMHTICFLDVKGMKLVKSRLRRYDLAAFGRKRLEALDCVDVV